MTKNSSFFAKLATEKSNPASRRFDRVSISMAISIIDRENAKVPVLVRRERMSIEKAVRVIVASLKAGGRIHFLGAGTSGRLGVLEAAECPPTFNTPPKLVQAYMAGGPQSVFASKEGAEDRGEDAVDVVNRNVSRGDVVIGVAASGVTAFVRDGLKTARARGAKTIFVTCNPAVPKTLADVTIAVNTGPEVIAGSTRLKAGTATKLVLNTLTVVSMTQMGKVLGNRMIDLQPKSKKLWARAVGLIRLFTGASESEAETALVKSGRSVKVAIVMLSKRVDAAKARERLTLADGHLHKALRFHL